MSLKVYLVRHGHYLGNDRTDLYCGRQPDGDLSQKGITQAKSLADFLLSKDVRFDAIYSSSSKRAIQTALCFLCLSKVQNDIVISDALLECSAGDWEEQKMSDCYTDSQRLLKLKMGYDFSPPCGESYRKVQRRMAQFIEEVVLTHGSQDSCVCLVSHSIAIKCLLWYIMNFDSIFIERMHISNTGFSVIEFNKRGWNVHKVNSTPHL